MMKKNPEREATLLDEWKKGTPAREAARITGVPEGTVYYYYKRFNRDPEKANRLAAGLMPRRKLSDADILMQTIKALSTEEVQAKFDNLVKEGKYEQAEQYIRAQREAERYRNERTRDVSSAVALFVSNPERNARLALEAAREMVQRKMDEGVAFSDAVSFVEQSVAAGVQLTHNADAGAKMAAALEALKYEHLAEEEAKKPEERISLSELVDRADREKEELERKQREAKTKEKKVSLDSNATKKLYELVEDQSTK
jgi:hypothetical protein